MKNYPLTAVRLRLMLSLSLFAIALIASVVVYFAYHSLYGVAVEVSHVSADSDASQSNVQTLQQLEKKLAENEDVVKRAGKIVADSKSYQYQNQIIADLNGYARKAGISITNIDFADTTEKSAASTPKAPAAPAAPAGVKSTYVSVTLANPVRYNNILRFIHSIEQNLTKMQIAKVGLAKGESGKSVTSEVLTIQVYIR